MDDRIRCQICFTGQCYSRKEKGDADWNDAIIRTIVTRRAVDAN